MGKEAITRKSGSTAGLVPLSLLRFCLVLAAGFLLGWELPTSQVPSPTTSPPSTPTVINE